VEDFFQTSAIASVYSVVDIRRRDFLAAPDCIFTRPSTQSASGEPNALAHAIAFSFTDAAAELASVGRGHFVSWAAF
jgi:hypothetical protein